MKKALITGGGGFVGRAIVRMLLEKGVECWVIGRSHYPDLKEKGVKCLRGDIADRSVLQNCHEHFDVVFHTAALAGIWGEWSLYYATNVLGTENIIQFCHGKNVKALVYTSTPSVVFAGEDIFGGDETLPYADKYLCNYAQSKMIAEKTVLQVDQQKIRTCAIRPHLIWGPGDPHLIPRLIERGRKKQLKIVGDGSNLVDLTYIDNVAHAHILAADNLLTNGSASGKPYFIGQEEPVNMWKWINELFKELGVPQVNRKVSLQKAMAAGRFLEKMYTLFSPLKEPKMTRFLALQLATSHYFSHKNATNDFNYKPIISLEEGMERLLLWLRSK